MCKKIFLEDLLAQEVLLANDLPLVLQEEDILVVQGADLLLAPEEDKE